MLFQKDEHFEKRLKDLEEQIDRLAEKRSRIEPGSDSYRILTKQLDGLYKEKEKHLTPWHMKPEGKAIIINSVFMGVLGIGLSTFELWAPHVGKTAGYVVGAIFRNVNRRV